MALARPQASLAPSAGLPHNALMHQLEVPQLVRNRARDLGEPGVAWLHGLDETVARLAAEWDLRLGSVLEGGSGALVVQATMPGEIPAILKVAVPDPDLSTVEAEILRAAEGHGYARLYHHNPTERAMVVERLGAPIWSQHLPEDQQLRLYCAAILQAWEVRIAPRNLTDGAAKAAWLADFIPRMWESLGHPCSERSVALALEFAARRHDAFDPARAIICHGDAHPGNLLAPLNEGGAYKFIDPEAGFIDREYDLACWLRGWRPAHPGEPHVEHLAREIAGQLAALTGTDPQVIWEWAFIERVSSGLLLMKLGHAEGALYLSIADQMAVP